MMQEDLLHKLHFLILEYYGIVEAKYVSIVTKGFVLVDSILQGLLWTPGKQLWLERLGRN